MYKKSIDILNLKSGMKLSVMAKVKLLVIK